MIPDTAHGKRIEAQAIIEHAERMLRDARAMLAMADQQEKERGGPALAAAHDVAAEYNRNKRPEDPPMWVATL